jgi:DNA-binding transcriptional LysR family regulator
MEHGGDRLKEMLLSGELELCSSLVPVSDDFEWQPVTNEPLVVVLPAKHELAQKKSADLLTLQHLPFILFERGC